VNKTVLLIFCVALTVFAYGLSRVLAKHHPSPLTSPVFFSTLLIVLLLYAVGLNDQDYKPAKDVLVLLLGPASVAIAVPIYRNRATLRIHIFPALAGIVVGCITTISVAIALSAVFEFSDVIARSMSVKSVTAPIAIELADIMKGDPALAAGFVIVTGMIGTMLGPWLLTMTGILHPLARGLALGTVSHGQGTAQALTEGSLQGAIAGIAMGLSAIATSFVLPFVVSIIF
jgi:putative effector of murein hydrolase